MNRPALVTIFYCDLKYLIWHQISVGFQGSTTFRSDPSPIALAAKRIVMRTRKRLISLRWERRRN